VHVIPRVCVCVCVFGVCVLSSPCAVCAETQFLPFLMNVVKLDMDASSLRLAVPESNVQTDDVSRSCSYELPAYCLREVVFSLGNCVFQQYGYCRQWQKE